MTTIRLLIYSLFGSMFSFYTIWRVKKALKLNHDLFEIPIKKNQPFVVLGTSDSINDINQFQWEKFRQWNTLGINYFLLNDFVPDIIQLELISRRDSDLQLQNLEKIFNHRKEEFANTIILIKNNFERSPVKLEKKIRFLNNLPEQLKPNLRFTIDFPMPALRLVQYNPSLNFFNQFGLFSKKNLKYIPHLRASLGLSTIIAIRQEPSEIIFGGVDLNHRRTFYNPDELKRKYDVNLPKTELFCEKVKLFKLKEEHRTINKELSEITILDVIGILDKHFSNQIAFSVLSKQSALREIMPLKKFN